MFWYNIGMKKTILKYDVVFEEAEEGGYTVMVPSLPGCMSEGDTFEEAKKNIQEAISLYLEDMRASDESIPSSTAQFFVGSVEVPFPHSVYNHG